MKITRRKFGKTLGTLGAGSMLGLASCNPDKGDKVVPSQVQSEQRSSLGQMRLRQLGRTRLMLSPVGFGAQRTRDADLIRYALDQGINYIETAWSYGLGGPGNSCECIGKAIVGRRDSVVLAVAYETHPEPTSKAWLANQFEQTLRDLKTDHIDIFLWHDSGAPGQDSETLAQNQTRVAGGKRVELMQKWKQEGKIRHCGVSTHVNQAEWLKFVAESILYEVAVVAFNYQSPKAIANAMEEAAERGVGLIAMKTQSPNYLQGANIGNAPDHRKALHWVLSKDYLTAAIPGMTTRDQVDLNLKTLSLAG